MSAFAKRLDKADAPPYQVGIRFFQVGNEHGAVEALQELDDGLAGKASGLRDVVDTVISQQAFCSRVFRIVDRIFKQRNVLRSREVSILDELLCTLTGGKSPLQRRWPDGPHPLSLQCGLE